MGRLETVFRLLARDLRHPRLARLYARVHIHFLRYETFVITACRYNL